VKPTFGDILNAGPDAIGCGVLASCILDFRRMQRAQPRIGLCSMSDELDQPTSTGAVMGADIHAVADEVFATIGTGRQISPFTSRPMGLTLDDGYRVTELLNRKREAQGEKRLGRKIGFTNRTIWKQYNVYAPIWGYVYESTVQDLSKVTSLSLAGFAEPRIEPEIVFGLATALATEMDETALLACLDWVAHGFEIVQSIFPRWQFSAADTVAANGVHGALLIGPRYKIGSRAVEWQRALSTFEIDLLCDGRVIDRGHSANVLDGPVSALRHLVGLLARDPINPPLAAGEIVTTGTLTRAMPVKAGETWSTVLDGIALDSIRLDLIR
jgi:2-keto-4-pentenoate hydratase